MARRTGDCLFSQLDLLLILGHQLKAIDEKVLSVPKTRFDMGTNEQITATIASELVAEPLELDESDISVELADAKIDISQDFNRHISNRSQPFYVDGIEVSYHLPCRRDETLLKCRGSQFTFNPPHAIIKPQELVYLYRISGRDVASTKVTFDEDLKNLRQWIPWVNEPVLEFNNSLEMRVRESVVRRRADIQKTSNDLNLLGYKVRAAPESSPAFRAGVEPPAARRQRNRQRLLREYDVALSFAGEDRDYVARVAERLKALDVSVFYDEFERVDLWGKDLSTHLADVYGKLSRFVVIFSSKFSAAKAWPNHERAFALGRQFLGDGNRVLPVRFDNTEIPGIPNSVSYLDLRVLTPEKLAELIRQKVDTEEG